MKKNKLTTDITGFQLQSQLKSIFCAKSILITLGDRKSPAIQMPHSDTVIKYAEITLTVYWGEKKTNSNKWFKLIGPHPNNEI